MAYSLQFCSLRSIQITPFERYIKYNKYFLRFTILQQNWHIVSVYSVISGLYVFFVLPSLQNDHSIQEGLFALLGVNVIRCTWKKRRGEILSSYSDAVWMHYLYDDYELFRLLTFANRFNNLLAYFLKFLLISPLSYELE